MSATETLLICGNVFFGVIAFHFFRKYHFLRAAYFAEKRKRKIAYAIALGIGAFAIWQIAKKRKTNV